MARRSPVSTGGIIGRSKDETDVNQFVGECLDLKNLPEEEARDLFPICYILLRGKMYLVKQKDDPGEVRFPNGATVCFKIEKKRRRPYRWAHSINKH